ncbi:MAG: hypothetical protein CMC70_10575 [Flavobacteriaceae bacterium]|nr:hypothetical protein [Flavobacteriaceae bacterium]
MGGPAQTQPMEFVIPAGEQQVQYSPSVLAYKVQNFEYTPEGTLKTVVGPCVYEPPRTKAEEDALSTRLGEPHGIFHAGLLGGVSDTLLIRTDTHLNMHQGWKRSYVSIKSGLSSDIRSTYPDQFLVLNNTIIWSNGVDYPLTISHDGMVTPLGFAAIPGAPQAEGPESPTPDQADDLYPNSLGYSWEGNIGTIGDVLDGQTGAIRAGNWHYHIQYEDVHGNLSQPSAPSNSVSVDTAQADPYDGDSEYEIAALTDAGEDSFSNHTLGLEIDDLQRQFLVRVASEGPDHCVAVRLYRTPDKNNIGTTPRFLARIPNNRSFSYPDNRRDSDLGLDMPNTIRTPIFRVMCAHQGRLVIGNVVGDPGVVRRSVLGLPGTFTRMEFVYPDSGGAEVTAVTSHGGVLLAFTENSVYSLEDFSVPLPLSQGIGCIAPRSIQAMPDGTLIWLSRDGFYGMREGRIGLLSRNIQRTIKNFVNHSRMRMAVSAIDPMTGEYRCALSPAGSPKNTLILCFDGQNWRRMDLGIEIADMCQTKDWRQYLLAVGVDPTVTYEQEVTSYQRIRDTTVAKTTTVNVLGRRDIFVLDRENRTYTPPQRDYVYRSGWIRSDTVGLTPMQVRSMYIGIIDSWDDDFEIRFYRNGSWRDVVLMRDIRAVGVDDETEVVNDIAGSAIIGQAKAHDPRLVWRQVPVGLENTYTWAFEIRAKYPTRLHIASFVFDVTVATSGNIRGRVPHRSDV